MAWRPPCATVIRLRSLGWRAIGASMSTGLLRRWPHTSAAYTRVTARRSMAPASRRCARSLFETMHDAGPALARAFRQRRPSPHEHVHETVAPVAGTGVHDESRRLVEHREMLVLKNKTQRGVVRRVSAWGCFVGQLDRYFRPTFQDRRGAQRFAARAHALVGDETSGLSAGEGELVGEEAV